MSNVQQKTVTRTKTKKQTKPLPMAPPVVPASEMTTEEVSEALGDAGLAPSTQPASDLDGAIAVLGVATIAAMDIPTTSGDTLYSTLHQVRRTLLGVHKAMQLDPRPTTRPPLEGTRECIAEARKNAQRLAGIAIAAAPGDGETAVAVARLAADLDTNLAGAVAQLDASASKAVA